MKFHREWYRKASNHKNQVWHLIYCENPSRVNPPYIRTACGRNIPYCKLDTSTDPNNKCPRCQKRLKALNNEQGWTLENMQAVVDKLHADTTDARSEWNKKFPPDREVSPIEDADRTTTYGIWRVIGGYFIIPKSRCGHKPESRTFIPNEIIAAIGGLINDEQ